MRSNMCFVLPLLGTAVYVICILTGSQNQPDGNTDMVFYIDGVTAGSFEKEPDGDTTYLYNQIVFAKTDLAETTHTLNIQVGHSGVKSLILLDAIVYTAADGTGDDGNDVGVTGSVIGGTSSSGGVSTTQSSISSNSTSSGALASSTSSSETSGAPKSNVPTGSTQSSVSPIATPTPSTDAAHKSNAGTIGGAVLAVVGGVALVLSMLFCWLRRRKTREFVALEGGKHREMAYSNHTGRPRDDADTYSRISSTYYTGTYSSTTDYDNRYSRSHERTYGGKNARQGQRPRSEADSLTTADLTRNPFSTPRSQRRAAGPRQSTYTQRSEERSDPGFRGFSAACLKNVVKSPHKSPRNTPATPTHRIRGLGKGLFTFIPHSHPGECDRNRRIPDPYQLPRDEPISPTSVYSPVALHRPAPAARPSLPTRQLKGLPLEFILPTPVYRRKCSTAEYETTIEDGGTLGLTNMPHPPLPSLPSILTPPPLPPRSLLRPRSSNAPPAYRPFDDAPRRSGETNWNIRIGRRSGVGKGADAGVCDSIDSEMTRVERATADFTKPGSGQLHLTNALPPTPTLPDSSGAAAADVEDTLRRLQTNLSRF